MFYHQDWEDFATDFLTCAMLATLTSLIGEHVLFILRLRLFVIYILHTCAIGYQALALRQTVGPSTERKNTRILTNTENLETAAN